MPPPNSLFHIVFSIPVFFRNIERFPPIRSFLLKWGKNIPTENRDTLSLHTHKFFRSLRFSEKTKGSPTKSIGTVRQKSSNKIVIPLLSKKKIPYQNISEKQMLPLWFLSVPWDKKYSPEEWDTPTSLIYDFVSLPGTFLRHRQVPHQTFSALWDKKTDKIVIKLISLNCSIPKLF